MTTITDLNVPFSSAPFKRIKAVRFTVLAPEDIVEWSVAKVFNPNIYEKGQPAKNGLNDPRLGPIDPRVPCDTCGGDLKLCPGHFGHMELARPMYAWGFLKTALKCLRCVCFYCSRLLVSDNEINVQRAMKIKNPKVRLQAMQNLSRSKKRCFYSASAEDMNATTGEIRGGCGYLQPRIMIEGTQVWIVFPEEARDEIGSMDRKRVFPAVEAYNILTKISMEDKERMGFKEGRSDPRWLLLTVLPIPPPAVRPTVSFGADRSEDDITMKLLDSLKTNLMLKKQEEMGAASKTIEEFSNLLQYHIFTLTDSSIPGVPEATTKQKKVIKSIRDRLKGKEGRLRGHLMGKRVDFSARTVITGDPNLEIDQLGVPRSIALNMTFAERVTPMNMQYLKSLVRNGPTTYPGAKFVIKPDGVRFDLRYVRVEMLAEELQYGWRVERHMRDGDFVIFNRQPSLHKMSMMGHRAKILPFSTFRMNLSVTSPYNADFDGDEMNCHLAQSEETRAEIKYIMMNPRQVVSPQGNKPVMGIVQDSLLAVAKFTRRDTILRKDLAMQLLMWLPDWDGYVPTPCILRPEPLWSGKQLFQQIIPKKLNLRRDAGIAGKNKKDDPDFSISDCKMVIRDGELITGVICKKNVGSGGGGLIHLIWLDHGPEAAKIFISYLQRLVNNWLVHHSFTCGACDIIANDSTLQKVSITLQRAKDEVNKRVCEAQRGKLETQPGKTMYQSFEAKVNQLLNAAREDAGKIGADSLDERNNIIAMVESGSKGSPINIAQIIACVGQQNVEGKRMGNGFRDRTLPHFSKDDFGPESRGFVENSYLAGLTPQEMYFHAMGGREGIIDTACKTSETGYIQRRLVKAMETLKVRYDGTIRDDNDDIVQFLYGEDGMDAVWIEDQTIDLMTFTHDKLDANFRHDIEKDDYGEGWLPDELKRKIQTTSKSRVKLQEEFKELKRLKQLLCVDIYPDGDSKQHVPIPISRLVGIVKLMQPEKTTWVDYYTPMEIVDKVNSLIKGLLPLKGIYEDDLIGNQVLDNATIVLNCHLRCHLASRRLLEKDRLTAKSVDWLLGEIATRFERSLAHSGEMVGTIAAQSVGEPATQMTLNTFHFAGVGSKNVTLGVPRLKEIINIAKSVKTPSLTVYLQKDVATFQEKAKDVQSSLEYSTLEKVTLFTQIFYDPGIENTFIPEDKEWVEEYYELPDEEDNRNRCSPWCLRIQLNNKVMTDKKLTMRDVGERIIHDFVGDLDCIFTDDNAEDLVLRLRLLQDEQAPVDDDDDQDEDRDFRFLRNIENNILKEMTLKGVHGIKKVFMREEVVSRYNEQVGDFSRHKEWVLDTDGCNLEEVLQVLEVDSQRTSSNDVVEIMQVLGVEGVRRALLREVRAVISFDGSYVNYRHLSILCDVMSNRGHLMSISRHGVNRADHGPLMKCSFEETVEILMDAAMYGEVDYCRSVSENIILGQLAPIGSNEFDVFMDDKIDEATRTCPLDDATPVLHEKEAPDKHLDLLEQGVKSPMNYSPERAGTPDREHVHRDAHTTLFFTQPGVPMKSRDELDKYDFSGAATPEMTPTQSPYSPFSPYSGDPGSHTRGGHSYDDVESPLYDPTSGTGLYTNRPTTGSSHLKTGSSPYKSVHSHQAGGRAREVYSSPIYSPTGGSGNASPFSPVYTPTGPSRTAPYTRSRMGRHPPQGSSHGVVQSSASPIYSPSGGSPVYSPSGGSPVYSPSGVHDDQDDDDGSGSPIYSPSGPVYSASGGVTAQRRSSGGGTDSPVYSPSGYRSPSSSKAYPSRSPIYSPTGDDDPSESPIYSPSYASASPHYFPSESKRMDRSSLYSPSVAYSPSAAAGRGDADSPLYSPSGSASAAYSPSGSGSDSPAYSPSGTGSASPGYSPTGSQSPASPAYSPTGSASGSASGTDGLSPIYSPSQAPATTNRGKRPRSGASTAYSSRQAYTPYTPSHARSGGMYSPTASQTHDDTESPVYSPTLTQNQSSGAYTSGSSEGIPMVQSPRYYASESSDVIGSTVVYSSNNSRSVPYSAAYSDVYSPSAGSPLAPESAAYSPTASVMDSVEYSATMGYVPSEDEYSPADTESPAYSPAEAQSGQSPVYSPKEASAHSPAYSPSASGDDASPAYSPIESASAITVGPSVQDATPSESVVDSAAYEPSKTESEIAESAIYSPSATDDIEIHDSSVAYAPTASSVASADRPAAQQASTNEEPQAEGMEVEESAAYEPTEDTGSPAGDSAAYEPSADSSKIKQEPGQSMEVEESAEYEPTADSTPAVVKEQEEQGQEQGESMEVDESAEYEPTADSIMPPAPSAEVGGSAEVDESAQYAPSADPTEKTSESAVYAPSADIAYTPSESAQYDPSITQSVAYAPTESVTYMPSATDVAPSETGMIGFDSAAYSPTATDVPDPPGGDVGMSETTDNNESKETQNNESKEVSRDAEGEQ